MPRRQSNQLARLIAVVVLVLISAAWSMLSGNSSSSTPIAPTQSRAERNPTQTPGRPTRAPATEAAQVAQSGLPTIARVQLPAEARTTLALIDQGGPFPYSRDGLTFQNREGRLPSQPAGYYREYTVETPGSDDRGARRIIAGRDGERFYTDDHYDSFKEIIR